MYQILKGTAAVKIVFSLDTYIHLSRLLKEIVHRGKIFYSLVKETVLTPPPPR
jgi:hypothetical protein